MAFASSRLGQGRRSSLIVSLVAALLAVASLPLGLAAYQIHLARESLVDQAQRTHLIAARATADRVQAALTSLIGTAESAAQNPQIYTAPDSAEAAEVLAGLLVGEARLRAAALFHREGEREVLVQMARQSDAPGVAIDRLARLSSNVLLQRDAEGLLWGISRDTPRTGLRLALLADASALDETLQPRELGPSARLLLLQSDHLHPAYSAPTPLPQPLLEALAQPQLDALATRAEGDNGVDVAAFARVAGADWAIASLQPAEEAEAAAASMRRGAAVAVLAVVVLIIALSLFAWHRVVQPVRALLAWQRGALSGAGGEGSDLANLRDAFEQIQRNQRNREAFGEVFVGRYRLLSTLGQGSMGSVFLAWDPRLKRHVAIKTMHLQDLDAHRQQSLAQLLEGEAVKVAKLQHPNIVAAYDLVAAGEFAFVVMEFVEGGNLRQLIDQHGALDSGEVVLIARAVLSALSAAHRGGLLHLDIKPSNLLVSPEGELKLADFGISAWRSELPELLTREGASGTPGFIAPEYVAGGQPTERSDLFSLGVVLVECMTGVRQNLPGARNDELLRAAKRSRPPPDASRHEAVALWVAVQTLCNADPALRPASAAAALDLFASMDASGAGARLAERVRSAGDRGVARSGRDSPESTADQSSTLRLSGAAGDAATGDDAAPPRPGETAADQTRLQPWAEETRQQPWTEDTLRLPPRGNTGLDDAGLDDTTRPLPQTPSSSQQDAPRPTGRTEVSPDDTTRPLERRDP
jgi:serine/threonine protein kinase